MVFLVCFSDFVKTGKSYFFRKLALYGSIMCLLFLRIYGFLVLFSYICKKKFYVYRFG